MNYKEYFKNTLIESAQLAEELRRFRTPAEAAEFRRQRGLPEPTRKEKLGKLSTSRFADPEGGRAYIPSTMQHEIAAARAHRSPRDMDPRDPDLAPTRPPHLQRSRLSVPFDPADAVEAGRARYRTQRLLDAVHYFSDVHNFQLRPEHIEGIDFSMGDHDEHIDEIFNRLRQYY